MYWVARGVKMYIKIKEGVGYLVSGFLVLIFKFIKTPTREEENTFKKRKI